MALLEVDQVGFVAGGHTILSGLTLSVRAGEMHALLGGNGAGKSSLANLIMGCQGFASTSGCIRFDGIAVQGLAIHERARLGISMAWQEPARFDGLRIVDYLTLGAAALPPDDALQLVGLKPSLYLNRMLDRSLSGGERKRIELASMLALRPKLAILDEPDSGIDMPSLAGFIRVLEAFRQHGSAVLLITHSIEVASTADRASLLNNGRIILTASPCQVTDYFMAQTNGTGGHHESTG